MPELRSEIERLRTEVDGWPASVPSGRYLSLRTPSAHGRRFFSPAAAAAILVLVSLGTISVGSWLAPPAFRATLVQMVTRERPHTPAVPEPTPAAPATPAPTPTIPTQPLLAPTPTVTLHPTPEAAEPVPQEPREVPRPTSEPSAEPLETPLQGTFPEPETDGGASRSPDAD